MKQGIHCGYIDRRTWCRPGERIALPLKAGPYEAEIDGRRAPIDVCPGWLVTQPSVAQVEKAYWANEKGALALYFPRAPHALLEAVALLSKAMSVYEAERMKSAE